jgi:hypothetical protein
MSAAAFIAFHSDSSATGQAIAAAASRCDNRFYASIDSRPTKLPDTGISGGLQAAAPAGGGERPSIAIA